MTAAVITFEYRCHEISVKNDTDQDLVIEFFLGSMAQGASPTIEPGDYFNEPWEFDSIKLTAAAITTGEFWIKGRA